MKIRIDINETLTESEVVIRCPKIDQKILEIQNAIAGISASETGVILLRDDKDYYVPLDTILFFETEKDNVSAHTADHTYRASQRLYELEEMLPRNFLRVSKSTILNINHIYSIDRNIASFSTVAFHKTHKQVYVSRHYYKHLKDKLDLIRRC